MIGHIRLHELTQVQEESNQFWQTKILALQAQVDRQVARMDADEEELRITINPDVVVQPPGPSWLHFVESRTFVLLATLILITNIAIIFASCFSHATQCHVLVDADVAIDMHF